MERCSGWKRLGPGEVEGEKEGRSATGFLLTKVGSNGGVID